MIDTDKYEGYSKGEWKIVEGVHADKDGKQEQIWGQPIHHTDLGMFFLDTDFNNDIPKEIQQRRIEARLNGQRDEEAETESDHWADAYVDEWIDEIGKNLLLAQDAPLLLTEVERLREAILEFADYLEEKVTPYMTNDMHEVVPIGGMVSDLRKMIKGDD